VARILAALAEKGIEPFVRDPDWIVVNVVGGASSPAEVELPQKAVALRWRTRPPVAGARCVIVCRRRSSPGH
jgi:hypothetical protein